MYKILLVKCCSICIDVTYTRLLRCFVFLSGMSDKTINEFSASTIGIVVYPFGMELREVGKLMRQFYAEALRLQKIFNFYDSDSELSRLNSRREMKASRELREVIKMALEFSSLTDGEYDISLGKQILQRKKGLGMRPIDSSYKDIEVKGDKIILHHPDALIDLGSIAKGYITDRLAEFLRGQEIKEFIIDSRGDIVVSGTFYQVIEIQHPRDADKGLFPLKLRNQAVATSGDYKQFYGSFENSHIVNSKDVISVTVVAKTLAEADVYATVLFVVDDDERARIMNKNADVPALVVRKDMSQTMYNGFGGLIYDGN